MGFYERAIWDDPLESVADILSVDDVDCDEVIASLYQSGYGST